MQPFGKPVHCDEEKIGNSLHIFVYSFKREAVHLCHFSYSLQLPMTSLISLRLWMVDIWFHLLAHINLRIFSHFFFCVHRHFARVLVHATRPTWAQSVSFSSCSRVARASFEFGNVNSSTEQCDAISGYILTDSCCSLNSFSDGFDGVSRFD